MPDILEADSVRKVFENKQVLTDIYLKCQTGDVIGLLGRNGSGKTTLLKILFGSINTENKHILINGKLCDRPFLTSGNISYLPQENFLPGDLTVGSVIGLYKNHIKREKIKKDERIEAILKTKVRNLSGGESRYLEVKIILNSDSKFVLLDEPFNGLTPIAVDLVKDMIRAESQNKGIILTDHDYRDVMDVANRYLLLFDGGLKQVRTIQDITDWGYIPDKK
jgi:lipopolysaccharide export system ATP-binding protein